jgi:hypothetical protein
MSEWIFSNSRAWYDYWEGELGGTSPDGDLVERVKAARRDGVSIAGTGGKAKFRRLNFQMERYQKSPPNVSLSDDVGVVQPVSSVTALAFGFTANLSQQGNLPSGSEIELADRTIQYDPNQAGVITITESWQAIDQPAQVWDAEIDAWVDAEDVIEDE